MAGIIFFVSRFLHDLPLKYESSVYIDFFFRITRRSKRFYFGNNNEKKSREFRGLRAVADPSSTPYQWPIQKWKISLWRTTWLTECFEDNARSLVEFSRFFFLFTFENTTSPLQRGKKNDKSPRPNRLTFPARNRVV